MKEMMPIVGLAGLFIVCGCTAFWQSIGEKPEYFFCCCVERAPARGGGHAFVLVATHFLVAETFLCARCAARGECLSA